MPKLSMLGNDQLVGEMGSQIADLTRQLETSKILIRTWKATAEDVGRQLAIAEEGLRYYANPEHWEQITDCDGIGFETHGNLYIKGPDVAIETLKRMEEIKC